RITVARLRQRSAANAGSKGRRFSGCPGLRKSGSWIMLLLPEGQSQTGPTSRLPPHDPAALVASDELLTLARLCVDFAGDFQVTTAAFAAADRSHGRKMTRDNPVVEATCGLGNGFARRSVGRLGFAEFGSQTDLALRERLETRLVAGDVLLQLRFGGSEALAGGIHRVHHLEFAPLQVPDERLRRLDLMPERLVLVVLPHRRLLRPVLREFFVRGRDFSLDALSLR